MNQKYDVVVIGAGIAGITTAIYLKRYGYHVLVIDKNYPGGQLNKIGFIENYPGFEQIKGPDFAFHLYEQAKRLEIPFLFSSVEKIETKAVKVIETSSDILYADCIVLATGRNPRKLGLELEEELLGRGISYCATCDGPFFKDKIVSVVGGGNSAIGEALYLSSLAKEVHIIHRRDFFRASKHLIQKIEKAPNIYIHYESSITSLEQTNGVLTSIKIEQKGINKVISTDGLFIYIGMDPVFINIDDSSIYDADGFLFVDENMETKRKGVYACGDAIKKEVYQLTTAVGEATTVAFSIHQAKQKNV
jgi:thioredoxin reductase (NADPH)